MRLLFSLDAKDYDLCTRTRTRNAARSIILRNGKVAMIHSAKYGFYKFPGGGIQAGEDPVDALIRETREESGLVIRPESIREYGYVHRIQRNEHDETECFLQDNFYYLCEAEDQLVSQELDDYEVAEGDELKFVDPNTAIQANLAMKTDREIQKTTYSWLMFEREIRVLELLRSEGYLS